MLFPEQLLICLVYWGSHGKHSMIDCVLGDALWFFPCQFWSTVLCGAWLPIHTLRVCAKTYFFYYMFFFAIMHRTTIVQNKIISIICSCLFFCLANIYRPSLGKVWLGRPNSKPIPPHNFYLGRRKKKTILLRIVSNTTVQSPMFNFDFHLFLKKL